MTRKNAREIAAQLVYEMNFRQIDAEALLKMHLAPDYFDTLQGESEAYGETPDEKQTAYLTSVLTGIEQRSRELDGYITKYAIGWNLERISRPARAIMQLAMYESLYVDDVPVSSAINEAVELTRKYADEDVVAFVNGILGSFAREVAEQ